MARPLVQSIDFKPPQLERDERNLNNNTLLHFARVLCLDNWSVLYPFIFTCPHRFSPQTTLPRNSTAKLAISAQRVCGRIDTLSREHERYHAPQSQYGCSA